jgi:hypothetical protein
MMACGHGTTFPMFLLGQPVLLLCAYATASQAAQSVPLLQAEFLALCAPYCAKPHLGNSASLAKLLQHSAQLVELHRLELHCSLIKAYKLKHCFLKAV